MRREREGNGVLMWVFSSTTSSRVFASRSDGMQQSGVGHGQVRREGQWSNISIPKNIVCYLMASVSISVKMRIDCAQFALYSILYGMELL